MNDTEHTLVSRRGFMRALSVSAGVIALGTLSACAASSREPSLRIVYPEQGARVPVTPVPISVDVRNFRLVNPGLAPRANEGLVHFFIDVPADSIADGQAIPLNQLDKYAAAGPGNLRSRVIPLQPGVHTITAVMADSAGNKLPQPAPVSVTFFVQPGGIQTK